jgi:prevent-host-death family protein
MSITTGTAEVKARLSEFLGRVRHGGERIIISRRGKPIAAIISMDDLHRLENIERESKYQIRETEHPIMRAYRGWADRDDLDELVATIYADRDHTTGREVDL